MSALARYFKGQGKMVCGYDKTSTPLTDALSNEGIEVHFTDDVSQIPNNIDLVIYTPAIPADLMELNYLQSSDVPLKKRAEVLGLISKDKRSIAVAGTHGKTTVSSMIAHILNHSSVGCNALLGGIAKNYTSNIILNPDSDLMVVEADEYDKSFLQLQPDYAVITAMDADHLDIYDNFNNLADTFNQFIQRINENGKLLTNKKLASKFTTNSKSLTTYTYSLENQADFYAHNINLVEGNYCFDIITPFGEIKEITLGMAGLINVENAIAASALALLSGAKENEIQEALKSFSGIHRRFDYQIKREDLIYIDDYAHHPEEINRFTSSVRDLYPNKKILGIFQPHLYSRTRDFADEFAKSLNLLDEVILLPIYPAREIPIEGIESSIILNKINSKNKSIVEKENILNKIDNKSFDILLTIGAGDIDKLVEPIKKHLTHKNPVA